MLEWVSCVSCRLHQLDPSLCGTRLPHAFHALMPQLLAGQEGVRFGTQQALKNLVNDCIDDDMIQTAVSRTTVGSSAPAPLQSIVAAIASTLGPRYQDAWAHALPGTALSHVQLRNSHCTLSGMVASIWLEVAVVHACLFS
jgi:hypothetical protein